MNYYDNDHKYLQFNRIFLRENFEDVVIDLEFLKQELKIVSITSDGHKSLIKAIKYVFPEVINQRCIIHIQRMSLIYLTMKPKTEAGQMLRCIVRRLSKINSPTERDIWVFCFNNWCRQYNDFLKEKSKSFSGRSWYTHKLLRRTRTLIKNALPDMFYYLNDSQIPKSTNGLETTFSYLKNNLKIHRGLSKQNRKNFILWYNYFKYLDTN